MRHFWVLVLTCALFLPVFAADEQSGETEKTNGETPKPTPIPRDTVIATYEDLKIDAGLFASLNGDALRNLARETEEVQKEALRSTLDRTLLMCLLTNEAKEEGVHERPDIAESLRQRKIDWLFTYFQSVYTRENFNPTEEEIQEYYNRHLDEFRETERYKFRHIFFKTVDEPSAKQEKALERAKQALAKLKEGADFVKVAEEYSESEKKGTIVGPFRVDEPDPQKRINPEIQKAVLALEPGRFSDIIKTKYGYEILRLEEYVKPEPKPLQRVRSQIVRELRGEFIEKSKREFKEKYMDEALTDWNPDIVDDPSAESADVICRVYGRPVTVGMYKALFKGYRGRSRQAELEENGRDEFIKEYLVLKMIAVNKAYERGLHERRPSIDRFKRFEIMGLFNAVMNERWDKYQEQHPITEEQIKEAYEEQKERLLEPRRAVAGEIIRWLPEHDETVMYEEYKAREAAKEPLLEALERIKAGEDFAAVAKDISEATTAADGGRVGVLDSRDSWRGRGFVSQLFRLKEGEVSEEPFEIEDGYALAYMFEELPQESMSLEESRARIRRMLLTRQRNEFWEQLMDKYIDSDRITIEEDILYRLAVPGALAAEEFYED